MLAGLIISGALGLVFVVIGAVMLTGRGSFLIAGFNTMNREEKERYDEAALCRFMGKIVLPIGLLTPAPVLSGMYDIAWLAFVFPAAVIGLVIFAGVYANTGGRFLKKDAADDKAWD